MIDSLTTREDLVHCQTQHKTA